jgi:hypothetical protein
MCTWLHERQGNAGFILRQGGVDAGQAGGNQPCYDDILPDKETVLMTQEDTGRAPDINDPDAQNAEQDDEAAQAQEVAEEALHGGYREHRGEGGSTHGGKTNPAQIIPDDAQDLVDIMEHMDSSGEIDMDAFEGEEDMDDEAED